jgi:truncated hemoglobin YjbI
MRVRFLEALGGEAGCKRLAADFYARVGKDPVLRPLFPGKSLRCATEEFTAFLIQFLGGDEEQTQHRWWLSLRESHARFQIGPAERSAWLKHMGATLDAAPVEEGTRKALRQFFIQCSNYVVGKEAAELEHEELGARWTAQRSLDDAVAAIAAGRDGEVLLLATRFAPRSAVFVGLLARMLQTGRGRLIRFILKAIHHEPSLGRRRFGGRTLLHLACDAGSVQVVEQLLRLGTDPNLLDHGGHTPLYAVANGCASDDGLEVVRALVRAGADVNACGGLTRATPLHMAARRGSVGIAGALLECGAEIDARDSKGDTPLQRALNCRRDQVAQLLVARGANVTAKRR